MLFLKLLFALCFLVVFTGGIVGIKRFDKWFGPDPNVPTHNESVTLINKSQFVMMWILCSKVCLLMACILPWD